MLKGSAELTRGRLLAVNALVSLAGSVLPGVSALAAIPLLVRAMGAERFGLLSLAWTLVGSFSAFDLGIGRALTQVLAERVGLADQRDSPQLTWTALWVLGPLGAVVGLGLWLAAPDLVAHRLHLTLGLESEAAASARLLAYAVPLMVLTSGLRGVLEAGQEFRISNGLRMAMSFLTFLGPCAVQSVTHALQASVAVLLGARVLTFALHAVAVAERYPALRRPRLPDVRSLRRLGRVAGWMTVSTLSAPLLTAADRFVIGGALPIAAVAHYATVSELTSKLTLFSATVQGVLFPALAVTLVGDPRRASVLFDRGFRGNALTIAPVVLVLVAFAPEVVRLWLGPDFVPSGAPVLQVLAIAAFLTSCAGLPYNALQSAGRADVPAKFHLVEVPLYLGALWLFLGWFGLVGVALAWLLRIAADTVALLAATPLVLREGTYVLRRAAALTAAGTAWLAACACAQSLPVRAAAAVLGLLFLAVAAGRWLVTADERALGREWIAGRRSAWAARRLPRERAAPRAA